jgi:phage gpG-like protein
MMASDWGKRVAKALRDPAVVDGIAKLVGRYAKAHIAASKGRGEDGRETALEPLAAVKGEYWTTTKPREGATVKATREVVVITHRKLANGKTVSKPTKKREYLVQGESYRTGGKPLRDTGQMMREVNAKGQTGGNGVSIIMYGPLHAIFHELGFETQGPNFIPLTKKGKRTHATGRNPTEEGLVRGKDFTMAWRGVTVPKRPFMIPTNDEWGEIGKSIRLGLARILKGKS